MFLNQTNRYGSILFQFLPIFNAHIKTSKMKRIYFLLIVLIAFAGKTSAQTDMQLITFNWKNGDTVRWNTSGSYGMIIQWGFRNIGPTALVQSTDTILLRRAYTTGGNNVVRLTLPTAGVPVGDTVYFRDTAFFTSGPTPNPYNWCDSMWVKRGSTVFSDPSVANNKNCFTLNFKQMPPASVGNVANNKNGLSIYPNPASNYASVKYKFTSASDARAVVKDMTGKTVMTNEFGKNLFGEQEFKLDVSGLANGLYIMEMFVNDDKQVIKFNVQK
ncbi:hypothetical protein CAP35_14420 [Chitinophagaceae bacterium IBVUCB1]|nr:hypothetical protein CAP35_14420 [Chitinophagaceae bacterium IBVUCB1]